MDPLIMEKIINTEPLHAKWLNTLSYLENSGARKISSCEHPTKVPSEMLKHAAEEFRHAYYLKQQIHKLTTPFLRDYQLVNILGGFNTLRYLDQLELHICRLLKDIYNYPSKIIKESAYLWITYAIELRASELYPFYHQKLKERHSRVAVKSIILEEDQHLKDIERELSQFDNRKTIQLNVKTIERNLFVSWIGRIQFEVIAY